MKITIRQKAKEIHNKGITLIALVITIIVLLILAGISIAMLTGENGILTKAEEVKKVTERTDIIERAKLEILEYEAENEGKITDKKAYEIIAKYDKDYKENEEFSFKKNENNEEYILTEKGYAILASEIWKKEELVQFTIDGTPLVAKKNETWYDWLNRMKDEPQDVVGNFVYYGLHEAKQPLLEFRPNEVSFQEYGAAALVVSLYCRTFQGVVQYGMIIEQRRILFTIPIKKLRHTKYEKNHIICFLFKRYINPSEL